MGHTKKFPRTLHVHNKSETVSNAALNGCHACWTMLIARQSMDEADVGFPAQYNLPPRLCWEQLKNSASTPKSRGCVRELVRLYSYSQYSYSSVDSSRHTCRCSHTVCRTRLVPRRTGVNRAGNEQAFDIHSPFQKEWCGTFRVSSLVFCGISPCSTWVSWQKASNVVSLREGWFEENHTTCGKVRCYKLVVIID